MSLKYLQKHSNWGLPSWAQHSRWNSVGGLGLRWFASWRWSSLPFPPIIMVHQWKMGVSPLLVSFQLGDFLWTMIMGERVNSYSIDFRSLCKMIVNIIRASWHGLYFPINSKPLHASAIGWVLKVPHITAAPWSFPNQLQPFAPPSLYIINIQLFLCFMGRFWNTPPS